MVGGLLGKTNKRTTTTTTKNVVSRVYKVWLITSGSPLLSGDNVIILR